MRRLLASIVLSAFIAAPALACGPATSGTRILPTWPPVAALDKLLPTAKLADKEMKTLKALRAEIVKLTTRHQTNEAMTVAKEAMRILGYEWRSFLCTPPQWVKSEPKPAAAAQGGT